MKNKKIKCDIYTRVSTTMQVDGYSLDAQKEKLKRYAEFQNIEIVNEYSDEGKSGKFEHQYKLHLIFSILNIFQHSLEFWSALYTFSRFAFV